MNVQQLIDLLDAIEDKTVDVVLWTDHGQTTMKADTVSVMYTSKAGYDNYIMNDAQTLDNIEEYAEDNGITIEEELKNWVEVVEIGAS